MDLSTFNTIVYIWIAVAIVIFPFLLFVTAPYGRHTRKGWGPMIPNHIGWILMELPALLVFLWFALTGTVTKSPVVWVFILLYTAHYVNRSVIFPFRLKTSGKKMPLSVSLMAISFNMVNGFINGYYLGYIHPQYPASWLSDPRMIIGVVLFAGGMFINMQSDEKLLSLRRNKNDGYQIPRGGWFDKISCPNFFGEIIEWLGFAVMTWSVAGLSFFIWTAVNLIPRAIDHHKWYKATFSDYPKERKAVLPYIL